MTSVLSLHPVPFLPWRYQKPQVNGTAPSRAETVDGTPSWLKNNQTRQREFDMGRLTRFPSVGPPHDG